MTLHAGHCTRCGTRTWRGVYHPKTLEWIPLFPDPTSVYAVFATSEGLAVGVGYCAACAPAVGDPGPVSLTVSNRPLGPSEVVRLDPAPFRYVYWYSDQYGDWLVAWTRELAVDHRTSEAEFEPVRTQWRDDREAVVIHG